MLNRRVWCVLWCLSFLLISCTRPPEIPPLSQRPSHPIERLALDGEFDVSDVRGIFRALNDRGALDRLKPWIEGATDEDINRWLALFQSHIYHSVGTPEGFDALLERRIESKTFSRWARRLETSMRDQQSRARILAVLWAIRQPEVLDLARGFSGWFSDDASVLLAKIKQGYQSFSPPSFYPPAHEVTGQQFSFDLVTWLGIAENRQLLIQIADEMNNESLGMTLLEGIANFNKTRGEKGIHGAALGLSHLLPSETQPEPLFERALQFISLANQNTDVLFETLSQQLDEQPAVYDQISPLLAPVLLRPLSDTSLRFVAAKSQQAEFWSKATARSATGEASAEWFALVEQVRRALESLSGATVADPSPATALRQLTVYAHSLALGHWLSDGVKAKIGPDGKIDLTAKDFTFAAHKIEFIQSIDGKRQLNLSLAAELEKVTESRAFVDQINQQIAAGLLPSLTYEFPEIASTNLKDAYFAALSECYRVKPFFDSASAIRLFKSFIPVHTGVPLSVYLNALLTGDLGDARLLKEILFKDLGFGDPSSGMAQSVLLLLNGDTETYALAEKLLNALPAVYELDRPLEEESLKSLPTPFELYHECLLSLSSRTEKKKAFADLLSFLYQSRWFSAQDNDPSYPSLFYWLADAEGPSRWISALGSLSDSDRTLGFELTTEMTRTADLPGWQPYVDFLGKMFQATPAGAGAWLEYVWENPLTFLAFNDSLSEGERVWLGHVLSDKRFSSAWKSQLSRTELEEARQLFQALADLTRSGELTNAFRWLQKIQDDRLSAVGKTLVFWAESGELLATLNSINELISLISQNH